MTVDEIRENRFRFLHRIWEDSEGSESVLFGSFEIGQKLGFDKELTAKIVQYLIGEDLVKPQAQGGAVISISHPGVLEVESALSNPDEPTTYFPPANTINIISVGQIITHHEQGIRFSWFKRSISIPIPIFAALIGAIAVILSAYIQMSPPDLTEKHDTLWKTFADSVYVLAQLRATMEFASTRTIPRDSIDTPDIEEDALSSYDEALVVAITNGIAQISQMVSPVDINSSSTLKKDAVIEHETAYANHNLFGPNLHVASIVFSFGSISEVSTTTTLTYFDESVGKSINVNVNLTRVENITGPFSIEALKKTLRKAGFEIHEPTFVTLQDHSQLLEVSISFQAEGQKDRIVIQSISPVAASTDTSIRTGLIIDGSDLISPTLSMTPQIISEGGEMIYGSNFVTRPVRLNGEIVRYAASVEKAESHKDKVGDNPLIIKAIDKYPREPGSVIISRGDAQKISDANQQNQFLKYGRVIVVY